MIVDPHGHIDDDDRNDINARFEQARGPKHDGGPPMYIISPNNRQGMDDITDTKYQRDKTANSKSTLASAWTPSFTTEVPEWVILSRVVALARKSRSFLVSKAISFESTGWSAAFHETTNSFKAYSALLRIDTDFAVDEPSSSTGSDLGPVVVAASENSYLQLESAYTISMRERYLGPKALRHKLYRNMRNDTEKEQQVLHDWRPVDALVERLRRDYGSLALFFYNHLAPDVVAILWRPHVSSTHPFSVMASEYTQPSVSMGWKADTMMLTNVDDVIREMSSHCLDGIVTKVKVFQSPTPEPGTSLPSSSSHQSPASSAKKRKQVEESSSSDDDSDASE